MNYLKIRVPIWEEIGGTLQVRISEVEKVSMYTGHWKQWIIKCIKGIQLRKILPPKAGLHVIFFVQMLHLLSQRVSGIDNVHNCGLRLWTGYRCHWQSGKHIPQKVSSYIQHAGRKEPALQSYNSSCMWVSLHLSYWHQNVVTKTSTRHLALVWAYWIKICKPMSKSNGSLS